MRPIVNEPEFDVIIVGSGIAGAFAAYRLAQARYRVLILEAGGVAPDSIGRWSMAHYYWTSPSKSPDLPFCADGVLPVDPKYPAAELPVRTAEPDRPTGSGQVELLPIQRPGRCPQSKPVQELLRTPGRSGSTWHWQGIYIRMLPNDFRMSTLYGKGFDWPISYNDLERLVRRRRIRNGRSRKRPGKYQLLSAAVRRFPKQAFSDAGLGAELSGQAGRAAVNGKTLPGFRTVPLQVNTVPHAINSRPTTNVRRARATRPVSRCAPSRRVTKRSCTSRRRSEQEQPCEPRRS